MKSVSIENFVKTVYTLPSNDEGFIRIGSLATRLKVSNAAISDMAKKLHQKQFIYHTKYKGVKLTEKGEKYALNILRKHRLWETFLHKVLGLSISEIHTEAEVLEHVTSDFLAQKIDDYLGQPTKDPHGTPIPSYNSKITNKYNCISIDKALEQTTANIINLSVGDGVFFDFCQRNQIHINSSIKIIKQYPNQMTEIETKESKLLLHQSIAKHIFIEKQ